MQEALSQVGEALRRAAERAQDSSGLHQEILQRAADLSAMAEPVVVLPRVASGEVHQEEADLSDGELSEEGTLDELIEVMRVTGSPRRKGAVRQTEQELSQEASTRDRVRVVQRTQANVVLRQASAIATGQRAQEIERQRQAQTQEEQVRQEEQARQERIAAKESEKEAQQQRAAREQSDAAERRAQKAADLEKKRTAKKAARATQPRIADIERQRRAMEQQPSQAPVAAEPPKLKEEQQRDLEELKRQYSQVGHNLLLLMMAETAAILEGIKRDDVQEQWEAARKKSLELPEAHQFLLIHELASGMRLTGEAVDPLWVQGAVSTGIDPNRLHPSDYFLYATSHLFFDKPAEEGTQFHDLVERRLRLLGPELPVAERIIFEWSKSHPK